MQSYGTPENTPTPAMRDEYATPIWIAMLAPEENPDTETEAGSTLYALSRGADCARTDRGGNTMAAARAASAPRTRFEYVMRLPSREDCVVRTVFIVLLDDSMERGDRIGRIFAIPRAWGVLGSPGLATVSY